MHHNLTFRPMLFTYRSNDILQQCKSLLSFNNGNITILNVILYNATITCYDRKWFSPPNTFFRLDRKWVDQTASLSLTTIHKTPYTVRTDSLSHTVLKFVFWPTLGCFSGPEGCWEGGRWKSGLMSKILLPFPTVNFVKFHVPS